MDEDQVTTFSQNSEPRIDIHCKHPQKFVAKIIGTLSPSAAISLVDFPINYPEQSYTDCNVPIGSIRLADIKTADSTAKVLDGYSIPRNHEVGVASRIANGSIYTYMPMIDFTGRPDLNRLRAICESVMRSIGSLTEYKLYDSGNSYHAYFGALIGYERLANFLRELTQYPEVDQRWVAHSRRSQVGPVLRWTSVSGHKGVVTEVGGLK